MSNTIHTVKDLIEYLQTLEPDKIIYGEYLNIINSLVVGPKYRPLLKDLIEKDFEGNYKFKALIY